MIVLRYSNNQRSYCEVVNPELKSIFSRDMLCDMLIKRLISDTVLKLAGQYPVLTITGPRQSGKTTLCKQLFSHKPYVTLEDPDQREFAVNDPRGFLAMYPEGAVLDEIQRAPSLFSYLQGVVDRSSQSGLFVLTGSQQFEVMAGISQSLAGRAAVIRLLPFSCQEAYPEGSVSLERCLYTGFYPRIFDKKLNPTQALSFYVNTYIERDVRQLLNVKDMTVFETFIRICAGRTGQLINYASMSADCGVDQKTIKKWLSVLEASYIVKLLQPYHKNRNKRLVKAPKLYFLDSGLACFLLGIRKPEHLVAHPLFGHLFETYVLGELWKLYFNSVLPPQVNFYRDHRGHEVDVIIDHVAFCNQMEIKSARTVSASFLKGLAYLTEKGDCKVNRSALIYGGEESYNREGVQVVCWRRIDSLMDFL
jgi:predicted AAA+ superfamily ATPase